jgi:hypothetical protein
MVFLSELALLLVESLTRRIGQSYDTRTYALKRSQEASGMVFPMDGSVDRSQDTPVNFTGRVTAIVDDLMEYNRNPDFNLSIKRINSTCIDADNIERYYTPSIRKLETLGQAGVIVSVMSLRSELCGYTSFQLISFLTAEIQSTIEDFEYSARHLNHPPHFDGITCFIQRCHKAIERLNDPTDPLALGFLTADTCYYDTQTPRQPIHPRPVQRIAVSEGAKRYDADMVDVTYPPAADYDESNTARKAWLLDAPASAAYASVWYRFPANHTVGLWDVFTVPGNITLRMLLPETPGRGALWLAGGCNDRSTASANITYTEEWNFISVSIEGRETTITFNDQSWKVRTPIRSYCADQHPFLGPRLERPWNGLPRPQGTIRFYDFKVLAERPASIEPLAITKGYLEELGTDIPIICNTRDGFERRVGLTQCIPRPLFKALSDLPQEDPVETDNQTSSPLEEIQREYHDTADYFTLQSAVNVGFAVCLLFLLILTLMTLKTKFAKTNGQSKTDCATPDHAPFDPSLPIAAEIIEAPLPIAVEERV